MSTTERKQKPKKGKVIRLPPDIEVIVELERREGETTPEVLRRLFGLTEAFYVLPSDVYPSIADANGAAIQKMVRTKQKKREKPIAVPARILK